MRTCVLKVDDEHDGLRLDVFLTQNLPQNPSRSFVQKLISGGHVAAKEKNLKSNYRVSSGEEIRIKDLKIPGEEGLKPENVPLDIFYEDDDVAVINKPTGMMVHPATGQYTGTLVNALLFHFKSLSSLNEPARPGIVHRLDKETSGLILIAKNNQAHARLARQFEKHTIRKRYIALVEGEVEFDEGLIDAPLGRHPRHREKKAVVYSYSKEAETFYRVINRAGNKTLIALFPHTGRTHQLRVHMAHLGHPILGDEKYGKKNSFFRLALHAQAIGFEHPAGTGFIEFSSRPPAEFLKELQK